MLMGNIQVHHITPGRSDKNFGRSINQLIENLSDEDWICLRDIDTMPLHHRVFFKQCEDIANSGEFDLVGCMTRSRNRFEKELSRARHYDVFCVVIEGTFDDIRQGRYRSEIHPNAVLQSIITWTIRYNVQFIWADDRDGGEYFTHSVLSKYLYEITRRYKIARATA